MARVAKGPADYHPSFKSSGNACSFFGYEIKPPAGPAALSLFEAQKKMVSKLVQKCQPCNFLLVFTHEWLGVKTAKDPARLPG